MSFVDRILAPVFDATVVLSYSASGYRLRERMWDPAELEVDCGGRTAVVTGANAGVGRALAAGLAKRGAEVFLVCRSRDRGAEAQQALIAATGNQRVHLEVADVSVLADVAQLVRRLRERTDRVDVLVNNAGVMLDKREVTPEGIELTFATNVLSGFALTAALTPELRRAGETATPSRVIHVTSGGMYSQKYNIDDVCFEHAPYRGVVAYAQTKRAQVILNEVWADRFNGLGITSNAMHPGWAATPGVSRSLPRFEQLFGSILRTPEQGADTALWLAISDRAREENGRLFFDRKKRATALLPWTNATPDTGPKLYSVCESLIAERGHAATLLPG